MFYCFYPFNPDALEKAKTKQGHFTYVLIEIDLLDSFSYGPVPPTMLLSHGRLHQLLPCSHMGLPFNSFSPQSISPSITKFCLFHLLKTFPSIPPSIHPFMHPLLSSPLLLPSPMLPAPGIWDSLLTDLWLCWPASVTIPTLLPFIAIVVLLQCWLDHGTSLLTTMSKASHDPAEFKAWRAWYNWTLWDPSLAIFNVITCAESCLLSSFAFAIFSVECWLHHWLPPSPQLLRTKLLSVYPLGSFPRPSLLCPSTACTHYN